MGPRKVGRVIGLFGLVGSWTGYRILKKNIYIKVSVNICGYGFFFLTNDFAKFDIPVYDP